MESLQELLDANDYKLIMKKFEIVKSKLDRFYYKQAFIGEVERLVLETMDYEEGDI